MGLYYLRNPNTAIVSHTSRYILVQPNVEPTLLGVEDGPLLASILERASAPLSREELLSSASEETVELLVTWGALLQGTKEELSALFSVPHPAKPCRHLVLGVSGAISASTIAPLVIALVKTFCDELELIFTEAAQKFIRPEIFEYRGLRVWTEPFKTKGEIKVPHMYLANIAEMVLILPTSANTLFKLANGACSDLLSLVAVATRAPVVLAPSMNQRMRTNPAIARNLAQLRADGFYVIEPNFGSIASKGIMSAHEVGAMGVSESNITATLEAILVAHRLPPETQE